MRELGLGLAIVATVVLTACGGSGDDGGGGAEVLEGDEALQAASEAAVSVAVGLQVLIGDAADTAAPRAVSTTGDSRTGARAVRILCPGGGSVEGECREDGGRTVVTTDSTDCSIWDEDRGVTVVSSGRAVVTYQATAVCGGTLPVSVTTTSELRDYREEWRDGATVVRVSESTRLDSEFRPGTGGCSSNQGTTSLDGDLRVRSDELDVLMRMRRLTLGVTSAGNPCDQTVIVDGAIEVEDAVRGSRFSGMAAGLTFATRRALDGFYEVALDGAIDLDCLGGVTMTTRERLTLGALCPLEGQIELSLAAEGAATARFGPDGLLLDYQADGTTDFESATCAAESTTVCW